LTRIRKISGDIEALRKDIQQALNLSDKEIHINRLTNHIIVKGWHKDSVERFLEGKGL
jgi:large subunit ribosomal protein L49